MGKMRYYIIAALAGFFCVDVPEILYSGEYPAMLVYQFFHANIFHLLLNCLAVWTVFDPRTKPEWWYLPIGYIISATTYLLTPYVLVGFSCVLFAIAGIRTPSFRSPWWRTWNCWVYIGTMLLMFLLPMFAASAHLIAFAMGVAVSACVRFKRRLDYDTRRAKGSR